IYKLRKYLLDTRDGVDRCINITQPNFVLRYIQHKLWHGNHRIGARSCIKTKSRKTDWTTGNQPVGQVRNVWRRKLRPSIPRSEEHTSELQSRFDLVCR